MSKNGRKRVGDALLFILYPRSRVKLHLFCVSGSNSGSNSGSEVGLDDTSSLICGCTRVTELKYQMDPRRQYGVVFRFFFPPVIIWVQPKDLQFTSKSSTIEYRLP